MMHDMTTIVQPINLLVSDELDRASKIHGATFASPHEGFGVIAEEVQEVGDELETGTPKGSEKLSIEDIVVDATGEHVGVVNIPNTLVRIPCGTKLEKGDMLRGPVRNRA